MKQQEKRIAAFLESIDNNLSCDGQSVLLSSDLDALGEGTNASACNNHSLSGCASNNEGCVNFDGKCDNSHNGKDCTNFDKVAATNQFQGCGGN